MAQYNLQAQLYQNLVPCVANPNNGNAWDWRTPTFTAYTSINNNQQIVSLQSPFFGGANANTQQFTNPLIGRDFEPEDGWELVQKDMGNGPNTQSPQGRYIPNPYFVLYNKYTGVLRFFVSIGIPFPTSGDALIEIGFPRNSPRPAVLDFQSGNTFRNSLDTRIDLPVLVDTIPILTVSNFYETTRYFWLMADFPINYDPCTCNARSSLNFTVWIVKNSSLNFTTAGNATQELDNTGKGSGGKFSLIKFGENFIKAGTGGYETAKKGIDGITNFFNLGDFITDNKLSKLTEKVLPGVGAALGLVDFAIGLFKKDSPPKPLVFNIDLRSTGNITSNNPTASTNITNPGSFDAINTNFDETIHYNNIMGIFNVLEKPVTVRYKQSYAVTDPFSGTYIELCDYYKYKLTEDIKYLVNPNANFKNPAKIEANWVFEFDSNSAPVNWPPSSPDLFYGNDVSTRGLYLQNDSTLVSYPVSVACLQDLDVAFTSTPGGTFKAFIKLTALLETNETDSREVIFIGKYPVQSSDVPISAIPNGSLSNIPENISIYSLTGLQTTTKAWNKINITIRGTSFLSNRLFIAGNEINVEPRKQGFHQNQFTTLNPGVTLELGDISECTGIIYPYNDSINNPDGSDYVKVFCRDELKYKFGRGYPTNTFDGEPIVESASDDGTIKYTTQLHAAYPNPTTEGLVNFTYELAESGNVMLYLSNAMGEQVAVLVNNQRQESGTHQFSLDVSQLPSGVYFYTLETNGFKQHKRLVVIR